MDQTKVYYEVQLPLVGSVNEYFTVCRAVTPEGAADVVRALLATKDRNMTTVSVKVNVLIGPIEW